MNKFLKSITLIAGIVCCTSIKSFSQIDQSSWQIGAYGGYSVYQGDLTPGALSGYKSISYYAGISGTRILNSRFTVKLNVAHGNIKSDEAKFSSFHKDRAFSFSTNFTEITPVFSWNIFDDAYQEQDQLFSPYVFAGAGVTLFDVKRNFSHMNLTIFNPNHWVNKGLKVDSAIVLPKSAFVIPIGAGTLYYLNDDFSLSAEFTYRFVFSDYLDGFSKSGNTKRKDTYHTLSIGIVHTLFSGSAGGISNPRAIF